MFSQILNSITRGIHVTQRFSRLARNTEFEFDRMGLVTRFNYMGVKYHHNFDYTYLYRQSTDYVIGNITGTFSSQVVETRQGLSAILQIFNGRISNVAFLIYCLVKSDRHNFANYSPNYTCIRW